MILQTESPFKALHVSYHYSEKVQNLKYDLQMSTILQAAFSQESPLYALAKGLDVSCSLLPQGPGERTQDLLKRDVSDMWRHWE